LAKQSIGISLPTWRSAGNERGGVLSYIWLGYTLTNGTATKTPGYVWTLSDERHKLWRAGLCNPTFSVPCCISFLSPLRLFPFSSQFKPHPPCFISRSTGMPDILLVLISCLFFWNSHSSSCSTLPLHIQVCLRRVFSSLQTVCFTHNFFCLRSTSFLCSHFHFLLPSVCFLSHLNSIFIYLVSSHIPQVCLRCVFSSIQTLCFTHSFCCLRCARVVSSPVFRLSVLLTAFAV
jgi:hypothetical protein